MNENEIILNIEFKNEDIFEKIAELTYKIEENKDAMKDLSKSYKAGEKTATEYEEKQKNLIRTNLENKKSIQDLTKEAQNNAKAQKQADKEKGDSLNAMRANLSSMKTTYANLSKEQRDNADVGKALNKQMAELNQEIKTIEQSYGDHQRSVGDYEKATRTLRQELKATTNEMQMMIMRGENDSEMYKELQKKAADLTTQQKDLNMSIKNMSGHTGAFDGLSQAVNSSMQSFMLFQQAISLVGEENEKLASALKKAQIATSALSAVTQIYKSVLKESSMLTLARTVLDKAGAAAQFLLGGAVTKTSIAFKGLRAALIATGIGALIVLIGTLIANMDKLVGLFSKSAKAQKEAEKAADAYGEAQRKVSEVVKKINNEEKNSITEKNNALREQTLQMQQNGKTEQQIAQSRLATEFEIRKTQRAAALERHNEMESERIALRDAIKAQEAAVIATKEGTKKRKEQIDKLNELKAAQVELLQKMQDERNILKDIDITNKEVRQKQIEDAKKLTEEQNKAAIEAAQKSKEEAVKFAKSQLDAQRDAVRQSEDIQLQLVKDYAEQQRKAVNYNYDRQIEDLKRKLKEDENLNEASRAAINESIINLDKIRIQELDKLTADEIQSRIDKETKIIDLHLQYIKKGTDEEYRLRTESLINQEQAELKQAGDSEEMKLAIKRKYDNLHTELEYEKIRTNAAKVKEEMDLEWQIRLDAVLQGSIEESEIRLEQTRLEHEQLIAMDAETKAALFESDTAYQNAVLNGRSKVQAAEVALHNTVKQSVTSQIEAARAISGAYTELISSFAEDSEAFAAFSKAMALFQIGLDTAQAIMGATKMSTEGDPYTYALRLAIAIGAVMSAVAKTKQIISQQEQQKAPRFAKGGLVSGEGSGTSDNIPAMLSNGESVMNANTTGMFAPLLSQLNQIGGGVPIVAQEASSAAIGEQTMEAIFSRALQNMPQQVVSVVDINAGQQRVNVIENIGNL